MKKEYEEVGENIGKLNVALVRKEIEMSSDSVQGSGGREGRSLEEVRGFESDFYLLHVSL